VKVDKLLLMRFSIMPLHLSPKMMALFVFMLIYNE